ncbi:glycosyl hydrolase [Novipirellula artificiosorum]|uniref:Glycosyl hydrolases family 2, sugar binding domain n=1 Tax=Novipirellula artificiosorum TaxID=2528016 RepID=A0A5C6DQ56_9BACT|nr:glycosyl hydrolase [Novipirellula artificiosorum]TWU38365.1 hypothetical protein Poly41_28410 [Novipirellula artificiosorum]
MTMMRAMISILVLQSALSVFGADDPLERQFRELPMEARRLTGPLFWMHGDDNETPQRLEAYVEKVAEGGNGCFTAESRPHSDWLGPRWYKDLDVCLQKAKQLDLKMWIFDEKWWPSQSIGGTVPPRYAAKTLVAEAVDITGPMVFEADGYNGERYIAAVAGRRNAKQEIEGESLLDLAPFITDGKLTWNAPAGNWKMIKFTHQQAPGLGQRGGKELSVDGASRDCTDWFLQTVYQPHYDHFKGDFGKAIPGFFYDEPETKGDWGSELNVILHEWGVDWKKAYVAYKFKLAGDDDLAARYQYMEAIAEAWGRVMYGGMTQWCHEHDVVSIGHFMEQGYLYLRPDYCAGDMMRLQKYSDMGGIDLVVRQMYPGQRPHDIYQTPKLGSSISHVYGKQDDVAMCEIFGGYNQVLTYPQMKWLTDQHQIRGINFMIPHSFNPKAPNDRDYPPYFYNDGQEPRWPLYRVYADYTSRLSLMLTGGRHVCPVAILFSGNAKRVGNYVTPEDMTTVLQDALYDCDWLPFEAFEADATLDGKHVNLHQERYQVLIVPPTEVIPYATLAKAKAFFDQGGVVIGYGQLPTKSGSVGQPSSEIMKLRRAIWGSDTQPGTTACRTNDAGGRSYFLPEKPDVNSISAALHQDAGIPPVVEVLEGETNNWLHVLHRVKEGKDVFLICNQDHQNEAKTFRLKVTADGFPEVWDAMRNDITSVAFKRTGKTVEFPLRLEPMESILLVFHPDRRVLPARIEGDLLRSGTPIVVKSDSAPVSKKAEAKENLNWLAASSWVWFPEANPPAATRYFRKALTLPESGKIRRAVFTLTADNFFALYVNGQEAGKSQGDIDNWRSWKKIDVTPYLKPGANLVAISAVNGGTDPNPAGILGRLLVEFENGEAVSVLVDESWKTTKEKQSGWETTALDDRGWLAAAPVASYGEGPWGRFAGAKANLVVATPFSGTCDVPGGVDLSTARVFLEMDELRQAEEAARVTVNGQYAGGVIGRPYRLDVTRYLQHGENKVLIEPFSPNSVHLVVRGKKEAK